MDEELKIVIPAELDEAESAQRIKNQLPNLAKLVSKSGDIKLSVSLDESSLNTQGQRIVRQAQQSVAKSNVKMNVDIGSDKIAEMAKRLKELKVPDSAIAAFKDNISEANIKVTDITTSFDTMSKTVTAVVTGVNKFGDTVRQTQGVKLVADENGEIIAALNKDVVVYQQNIEKVAQAEAKRAAQEAKDNESRVSYLTKQQALLADIKATYTGATSAKPVTSDSHLTELNNTYSTINAQIQSMIANEGKLDSVQRSNLEAQISGLKRMVKEYQNAEYVATKFRTKTVGEVNAGEVEKLSVYEQKLRDVGILTDTFQNRIAELRTQLGSAFDSSSLTAYLNNFDRLSGEVDSFKARIQSVDSLYQKLGTVSTQVVAIQKEMLKTDFSSEKNAGLTRELELRQQEEISLGRQIAAYQDIVGYSNQAAQYEMTRLNLQAELATSEGAVADTAEQIAAAMSTVGTSVELTETKFRALSNPTDELREKVANLRTLMDAVNNASSNTERVNAFKRLNQEIEQCNTQIRNLNGIDKLRIGDQVDTAKLEKAKNDLATVGRQWSALKRDPGLNAQFQQLGQNLKLVERGQMNLKAWTAQFSAFKSEVKAAGMNVMSLSDTIKNNVAKVTQWVSATTILFATFRKIREAITIVKDLDTAMVDLRKTTNETEELYRKFYYSANETAKSLGVTTKEVIAQAAEWSRLGYSMQEAAKMAENSAIFTAISPELSMEESTDGLISVMKAFGYEADEVLDGVISKINRLGNELAVSNKDIIEVMTRSSAAMQAANNSFEQTAALGVAAVEITRNSEQAGNALRTLSMRIRGYDEETEEYSEDLAVLRGTIADLTKVASNNNRGVSLFEVGDPEQYRSTYDILKDIADIWDELTDKNQAQLLEALFGKQRAQVGAAILSNFESAESAMTKMQNSAGNAMQEMDKIYDSLEYKLNRFQETWVGVAQNLIQTDQFKFVVDFFTGLSGAIEGATSALGLFGTAAVAVLIGQVAKSVGGAKIRGLPCAHIYFSSDRSGEPAA